MVKRTFLIVTFGVGLSQAFVLSGETDAKRDRRLEYRVKAAFLLNFLKFVQWPREAFASVKDPLSIAVVGRDPFGADLDAMLKGKKIRNRSLAVRRFQKLKDVGPAHLLWVSDSEKSRTREIMKKLKKTHTLTVGDTDDFIKQGGMVLLRKDRNRIRFEVHLVRTQQAGLKVSSKLLKLAKRVYAEAAND